MSDYEGSDARADRERQAKYGMQTRVARLYWVILIGGVGWWLGVVQWLVFSCIKFVVSDATWWLSFNPDTGDWTGFVTMFRWIFSVIIAGWLTHKLDQARWKNPWMWKKEEPKPNDPPKFFKAN